MESADPGADNEGALLRKCKESIVEPPDWLEKVIRFGCSLVFGYLVTLAVLLGWMMSTRVAVACSVMAGLLCGYVSLRFRDPFWKLVSRWWWPWR